MTGPKPDSGHNSDTLTIPAAAARLGVNERTLRRWVASGKVESIPDGRRRLIPISALAGLVTESTTPGPDTPTDTSGTRADTVLTEESRERVLEELVRLMRIGAIQSTEFQLMEDPADTVWTPEADTWDPPTLQQQVGHEVARWIAVEALADLEREGERAVGLTEELAALRQERAELAQKQFLAELNGLLQAVRELLDQRQREELAQLMRTLGDPCQGFGAVRMMEELLTWINVQLLAVIEQLQQIGSMLGQQAKLDLLLGDVEPGQLRTWLAQQEIDDLRALVDDLVQLKEEWETRIERLQQLQQLIKLCKEQVFPGPLTIQKLDELAQQCDPYFSALSLAELQTQIDELLDTAIREQDEVKSLALRMHTASQLAEKQIADSRCGRRPWWQFWKR